MRSMTDYTEADAAAMVRSDEEWNHLFNLLRTENARLAADLAAARAERDALAGEFHGLQRERDIAREQRDDAVANWEDLKRYYAADTGDIERERDAARQEAADWRLLAECCALRGVMQFLTAMRHINEVASGHDGLRFALTFLAADSHRGDITRSLVDAARRLAAPHLNPAAEGGGK